MPTEYPRIKLIAGPRAKDTQVVDLDSGATIPVRTVGLMIDVRTGECSLQMTTPAVAVEYEGPGRLYEVCPKCRREIEDARRAGPAEGPG